VKLSISSNRWIESWIESNIVICYDSAKRYHRNGISSSSTLTHWTIEQIVWNSKWNKVDTKQFNFTTTIIHFIKYKVIFSCNLIHFFL
jgi:hypothetical protein